MASGCELSLTLHNKLKLNEYSGRKVKTVTSSQKVQNYIYKVNYYNSRVGIEHVQIF